MPATFKIAVNASRLLLLIVSLAHAGAAAIVLLIDIPVWMAGVSLLLVVASWAISTYGTTLGRSMKAIVALELAEDGRVSFQTRSGEWCEARLEPSSFVAPYLTVLNLKSAQHASVSHVVLLPDSLDAEDFRRLRVWLRWRREVSAHEKN